MFELKRVEVRWKNITGMLWGASQFLPIVEDY
jgi:hypothetical protein